MKLKLPYNLRGNQKETIESIETTIENRNHIVLESPTGSGKTFISLAATLPFVFDKGLKIVYCVRTNSQQKQVIHELEQFKNNNSSAEHIHSSVPSHTHTTSSSTSVPSHTHTSIPNHTHTASASVGNLDSNLLRQIMCVSSQNYHDLHEIINKSDSNNNCNNNKTQQQNQEPKKRIAQKKKKAVRGKSY